jgi:hypothetical protein
MFVSDNTVQIENSRINALTIYGIYVASNTSTIRGNKVKIVNDASGAADGYAIWSSGNLGVIDGNEIYLDVATPALFNIGVVLLGDRNVISNNVMDLVNTGGGDNGFSINGDYNMGGHNVFYRCGTNITDSGTGNNVT